MKREMDLRATFSSSLHREQNDILALSTVRADQSLDGGPATGRPAPQKKYLKIENQNWAKEKTTNLTWTRIITKSV